MATSSGVVDDSDSTDKNATDGINDYNSNLPKAGGVGQQEEVNANQSRPHSPTLKICAKFRSMATDGSRGLPIEDAELGELWETT
jgi:hypothetical protein